MLALSGGHIRKIQGTLMIDAKTYRDEAIPDGHWCLARQGGKAVKRACRAVIGCSGLAAFCMSIMYSFKFHRRFVASLTVGKCHGRRM